MTEREALLRAVCEFPDDDTPRLVFADWLQEHGDEERAEFIRLQIEQTRLKKESVPWWKCESRARKLLKAHERQWDRDIVANNDFFWGDYVRGFAEAGTAPTVPLLKDFAKPIFSRTPLKRLRIHDTIRLSELCRVPQVFKLSVLTVSAWLTSPDEARQFLEAAGTVGPTILELEDRGTSAEVLALLTDHFGGRLMLPNSGDEFDADV
jgi:uncharacterized protein (TIGR02996 family)